MVYNILEVANTHGGNFDYMISLIEEFKEFDQNTGIKFQPFKYDEIALPDFSWYHVYEDLFFSTKQWEKIISNASNHKDIWIDVFDAYSIEIIKENLDKIHGFKLQASVLYNKDVITELSKLNLENKKIILNISGYEIIEIKKLVSKSVTNSVRIWLFSEPKVSSKFATYLSFEQLQNIKNNMTILMDFTISYMFANVRINATVAFIHPYLVILINFKCINNCNSLFTENRKGAN